MTHDLLCTDATRDRAQAGNWFLDNSPVNLWSGSMVWLARFGFWNGSADLRQWSAVSTVTLPTGGIVDVAVEPATTRAFYRARSL